MKILFIYRDKHFDQHNFKDIFNKSLCKLDFGFLLISIKTFADVDTMSLREYVLTKPNKLYDHVLIDSKIRIDYAEQNFLPILKKNIRSKVSIFLSFDRPLNIRDVIGYEKFLDVAYYFVPNLLQNYDYYDLPTNIKDKLFSTHYGLGFLNIPYDFDKNMFLSQRNLNTYSSNIFYSGLKLKGKQSRTEVIEYLLKTESIKNKNINYYDEESEKKYKLSTKKYIDYTTKSKINLVLSGNVNNITYRLYEVMFLRSFFLTEINFINYKISENFKNYNDFVFKNLADLNKKIDFYINNYEAALIIREDQSKIFNNLYNPKQHGKIINKLIFE